MNKGSTNECVPCPVGDPWITCRSKSHHNRIYYYNTVTGEAIWNLTDFENDKCKKTTKLSDNYTEPSENYPEPNESPQDFATTLTSKIFVTKLSEQNTDAMNEYIDNSAINKTFNQPSLSPNIGVQCYDQNLLNHLKLSIPVAPTVTPNLRNILLINQPQFKMELSQNSTAGNECNYVHTTSLPLSKRFKILRNGNNFSSCVTHEEENSVTLEVPGVNTCMQNETNYMSSIHQQTITTDLRQILSLKRQTSLLNNIEPQMDSNKAEVNSSTYGIMGSSYIEEHLEENSNQVHFTDTIRDTKSVKKNVNSKSENCIYIVPDANVVQNNYKFLNLMFEFDESYHLLVLEKVVEDIRNTSRSDFVKNRKMARLAMTFISQNIRTGFATIVRNPIHTNNTGQYYILDCCLKLVEEHDKVILLSNSENLKEHENAAHILILTVNELKSLVNTVGDATLVRNKLFPNKICLDVPQHFSNDTEQTVFEYDMMTEESLKHENDALTTVSIGIETDNAIQEKNTVDVCVQTDLDSEILTRILNSESVQAILAHSVKLKDTLRAENSDSFLKRWDLKHPVPKAITNDIDNNAKQRNFKWRRKRPRSLVEQQDQIHNSLPKDTTLQIPKPIEYSEVGNQVHDKSNVSADDNIPTTEDSSTSGIASATPSHNDYWSEFENSRNMFVTSVDIKGREKDSKNVMFEVTSQAMNDNLKSRSDEWVSRFVQIMEEALTQVLQKNPTQYPKALAPPWTLYEATTCIRMKFHDDCDIDDAANKLANTITKISNKKGTVNIHMSPNQYMEMYSYGVYLIDTLQGVFEGCEDLQTASESLTKLLNDIQYPNLATNQNDTFTDIPQEDSIQNTSNKTNRESEDISFLTNNEDSLILSKKQTDHNTETSPSKYQLRSRLKKDINKIEEKENDDKKADNKNSILSTLDLKHSNDACEKDRSLIDNEPHTPLSDPPILKEVRTVKSNLIDSATNVMSTNTNIESNQPKIIINFTQCADYEEKLKKRQKLGLKDNNDFEDPYLDYDNIDGYTSIDEYNHYQSSLIEWPNGNENFGFENIFTKMLEEIRQTFIIVFAFCMTCQKGINISDPNEKLLAAEEVYSKITNVCNALSRMTKREDTSVVSRITEVLKSEGIENVRCDESDLKKYKEIISKYLEQANLLRECLATIIRHMNRYTLDSH